jgi:hypothetical protein
MMFIVDAHEVLPFNALLDGRDYLRPALETGRAEEGGPSSRHVFYEHSKEF